MKKTLLIAAVLVQTFVFGQKQNEKLVIEKGTWTLGGKLSVQNSNTTTKGNTNSKNKVNYFGFTPQIGYTVSDNLVVGIELGYEKSKSTTSYSDATNDTSQTGTEYSFAPYVKKFIPISNKFAFHVIGKLNYTKGEQKSINNTTDTKRYAALIQPGISYFVSPKFAFEANMGQVGFIKTINNFGNNEFESNLFDFSLNPSNLTFGLSYFF